MSMESYIKGFQKIAGIQAGGNLVSFGDNGIIRNRSGWDYAPAVGGLVGAGGLGLAAALIGNRKKRIRNFVLGALLGGALGTSYGALIGEDAYNTAAAKLSTEKALKLRQKYNEMADIAETYYDNTKKLGLKRMPTDVGDNVGRLRAQAEALENLSGPYEVGRVMGDEGAAKATSAIRIPEDAETFKFYNTLANTFGRNGKYKFIAVSNEDMDPMHNIRKVEPGDIP